MKKIYFGLDARLKLLAGAELLYKCIHSTYGPMGSNVMIDRPGTLTITKDGVTVVDTIETHDRVEDCAIQIIQEACRNTNDEVGDGTTTTAIFAYMLALYILKLSPDENSHLVTCSHVDSVLELVKDLVQDYRYNLSDKDSILKIAKISTNNNVELAELITKAFIDAGQNGSIVIEDDKVLGKCHIQYDEGTRLPCGYISSSFINTDEGTWEAENVKVLFAAEELDNPSLLNNAINQCHQKDQPLLIVASRISEQALKIIESSKGTHKLNICVVVAPMGGDRQYNIMEDLSILAGGTMLGRKTIPYLPLGTSNYSDLGTFSKVIVSKLRTLFIKGSGDKSKIKDRVKLLDEQIANTGDDYDRERYKERAAWLKGWAVRLMCGAPTELEQKQIKSVVEDGVSAIQSALKNGVMPGGGVVGTLIARSLQEEFLDTNMFVDGTELTHDKRAALTAVVKTLETPFSLLCRSVQINPGSALKKLTEEDLMLDIRTKEYHKVEETNVLEPVSVFVHSLINGFSAAKSIAGCDCAIVNIPIRDGLDHKQRASKFFKNNYRPAQNNYMAY